MKTPIRFIVVDDDAVNNLLCSLSIEEVAVNAETQLFEVAEKAFEYITNEYSGTVNPTILFLDINMPTWSGWNFLDNFEKLDDKIKKQFVIYMLSSSVDPCDKQRATENKNVVGYIEKPLSEESVRIILEKHSGFKQTT
jgi:CheY-like chemotaxis protein